MNYRYYKRNMSHPFTAYFFLCDFNPTTVANDATVADTFIFAAMTFVILNRPENPFTKKTVTFGFVGSVVNGLRFKNFSVRAFKYFLW
jgi:hypothetical protein